MVSSATPRSHRIRLSESNGSAAGGGALDGDPEGLDADPRGEERGKEALDIIDRRECLGRGRMLNKWGTRRCRWETVEGGWTENSEWRGILSTEDQGWMEDEAKLNRKAGTSLSGNGALDEHVGSVRWQAHR